jgi:hypothetical protein
MELSFREMTKDDIPAPGDRWVEVTQGLSGWFAVIMWMSNERIDLGPFPEPFDTGPGRYATRTEAVWEALTLAEIEGLPYRLPKEGV